MKRSSKQNLFLKENWCVVKTNKEDLLNSSWSSSFKSVERSVSPCVKGLRAQNYFENLGGTAVRNRPSCGGAFFILGGRNV